MSDSIDRAVALFIDGDWLAFQSFCAGLPDAQWRALFRGKRSGWTVVGWMLNYNPPPAAWLTVKAAADRLGVQILSQTDDNNFIPLHYALGYCSVVAVVSSVIEGTPPTMLYHNKNSYDGRTPIDLLNSRDSSLANSVEITALFQSALSVSACVMLYACRRAAKVAGRRPTSSSLHCLLTQHTTSPSTLTTLTANRSLRYHEPAK